MGGAAGKNCAHPTPAPPVYCHCTMRCTVIDLTPLIARVWPRLVALVAHIAAMVAHASPQDRAVRLKAMRLLRPAEALARRIITLLADQMDSAPLVSDPRGVRANTKLTRKRHSTGFILFEPVATCAASIGKAGRRRRFSSGPRIVDLLGAHPALPHKQAVSSEPPLSARIAALQTALETPERPAMRLARRRARALSSDAPRPRLTPLRPGWPPGIHGRETPDWLVAALDDLNAQIRCRPPPDPESIRRAPVMYDTPHP